MIKSPCHEPTKSTQDLTIRINLFNGNQSKNKKKIWQTLPFEFLLGQQLAVVNHIN